MRDEEKEEERAYWDAVPVCWPGLRVLRMQRTVRLGPLRGVLLACPSLRELHLLGQWGHTWDEELLYQGRRDSQSRLAQAPAQAKAQQLNYYPEQFVSTAHLAALEAEFPHISIIW